MGLVGILVEDTYTFLSSLMVRDGRQIDTGFLHTLRHSQMSVLTKQVVSKLFTPFFLSIQLFWSMSRHFVILPSEPYRCVGEIIILFILAGLLKAGWHLYVSLIECVEGVSLK